jgi:hypothetical protein
MTTVRTALRQHGISPKLVADLLTSIVAFAVTYFGIDLDPVLSAGIAKGVGFIAGFLVGPGTVEVAAVTTNSEAGYTLVEIGLFLLLVAIAAAIVVAFVA